MSNSDITHHASRDAIKAAAAPLAAGQYHAAAALLWQHCSKEPSLSRKLLISGRCGEGKSVYMLSLAAQAQRAGYPVLLINCILPGVVERAEPLSGILERIVSILPGQVICVSGTAASGHHCYDPARIRDEQREIAEALSAAGQRKIFVGVDEWMGPDLPSASNSQGWLALCRQTGPLPPEDWNEARLSWRGSDAGHGLLDEAGRWSALGDLSHSHPGRSAELPWTKLAQKITAAAARFPRQTHSQRLELLARCCGWRGWLAVP